MYRKNNNPLKKIYIFLSIVLFYHFLKLEIQNYSFTIHLIWQIVSGANFCFYNTGQKNIKGGFKAWFTKGWV
jgi:hypothetical protein